MRVSSYKDPDDYWRCLGEEPPTAEDRRETVERFLRTFILGGPRSSDSQNR